MRASVSFLIGIVSAVVVATFIVLVAQNAHPVTLAFPGGSIAEAGGALLAVAAVVGFALALVIATPGRVAAAGQHRRRTRQLADTQQRLTLLREMYAELHGDYQRLFEEHWHLLNTVAMVPSPRSPPPPRPRRKLMAQFPRRTTRRARFAALDRSTHPANSPGHLSCERPRPPCRSNDRTRRTASPARGSDCGRASAGGRQRTRTTLPRPRPMTTRIPWWPRVWIAPLARECAPT